MGNFNFNLSQERMRLIQWRELYNNAVLGLAHGSRAYIVNMGIL